MLYSATAVRTRQRHTVVRNLIGQGLTITAVTQHLGLDRKTVRKYRDADNPEQLINGRRRYSRAFDAFVPYLQQRIHQDGITNAAQLFTELRRQGYRGSRRTVRRYLEPLRATAVTPGLPPAPLTVGQVTRWITSHPDHLTDEDKTTLHALLDRSPHLAALSEHVTAGTSAGRRRTPPRAGGSRPAEPATRSRTW